MDRTALLIAIGLQLALTTAWCASAKFGADANPTGDPIGGGEGCRHVVTEGDYTVANAAELLDALGKAEKGQTVCVASGAEVDLTGNLNMRIPDGVILAGDRGRSGSAGPLLFTTSMPNNASFLIAGNGARVTGLRIRGPDANFPDIDYGKVARSWTRAIMAWGDDIEVDNCEVSNFHHSGVCVQGANLHVHHCHIHSRRRTEQTDMLQGAVPVRPLRRGLGAIGTSPTR